MLTIPRLIEKHCLLRRQSHQIPESSGASQRSASPPPALADASGFTNAQDHSLCFKALTTTCSGLYYNPRRKLVLPGFTDASDETREVKMFCGATLPKALQDQDDILISHEEVDAQSTEPCAQVNGSTQVRTQGCVSTGLCGLHLSGHPPHGGPTEPTGHTGQRWALAGMTLTTRAVSCGVHLLRAGHSLERERVSQGRHPGPQSAGLELALGHLLLPISE